MSSKIGKRNTNAQKIGRAFLKDHLIQAVQNEQGYKYEEGPEAGTSLMCLFKETDPPYGRSEENHQAKEIK